MQRRLFSWVALLAVGIAAAVAASAATAPAAPSAVSAFELTVDATWYEGPWVFAPEGGTFRSRAPFCETGKFVGDYASWRFTCDDGTGGLTVSLVRDNTAWLIVDGSGSYADLRGSGSLRGEFLLCESCDPALGFPFRGTLNGVVDHDAVAPTIAFSSATATKLRRPAGAYALRLGVALRDNVTGSPVSYTLRVYSGGRELEGRSGTATTEAVSMTVRIRPPARTRTVRLELGAEDPVGNAVTLTSTLRLPR